MNAETSLSSIRVVSPTGGAVTGVGKYRYIGKLAEGGMADVFLAVTQSPAVVGSAPAFEKLVVIKQLRPDLGEDPTFVKMFMDEARLAARLNHPNVVQTLEVGTDELTGLHFIAMEFLEGVAYVRFARKKEQLPVPLSYHLRIIIDTLRGLHYAHELRDFDGRPLNVVHRDVSPQNIMLTWAGGVKVLDFGIAKAALASEARPEDFKGKLEYMAPEQACREEIDRRADVFSVGVMLHEALTRRRLFRKGEDKLTMLVEGKLPHVLDVAPNTTRRLADICMKAMAHEPHHRYETADAMADELEEWMNLTQQTSARDVGAYIAEMFASTRTKITQAVDEQVALFKRLADSPQQGMMPLHRLPFTEFQPEVETAGSRPVFGNETVRGLGAPPPPSYGSPPSSMTGPPPMMLPIASIPVSAPIIITNAPARSNLPLILVSTILGGVLLTGGALGFVWYRAKKHAPAPTPAVVAPAPVPVVRVEEIDYTIRATPPEAKLFVDGQPMSNPAIGKRPIEQNKHSLRIEAPGYEPREESVTFDRNLLVSVELHPIPPPPPDPPKKGGKKK